MIKVGLFGNISVSPIASVDAVPTVVIDRVQTQQAPEVGPAFIIDDKLQLWQNLVNGVKQPAPKKHELSVIFLPNLAK